MEIFIKEQIHQPKKKQTNKLNLIKMHRWEAGGKNKRLKKIYAHRKWKCVLCVEFNYKEDLMYLASV
jgi:hypothetical protein